jgi:RecB family exonuclease
VITARRTRLLRVPDLRAFQRTIAAVACRPDIPRTRACAVIVPTRSAADQLRRTLENLVLGAAPFHRGKTGSADRVGAFVLPDLVTREDWYRRMHERLGVAPPRLARLARQVLLGAASRDAIAAGFPPPFRLRPGLQREVLDFYDTLRRHRRAVDDFERLVVGDLEPRAEADRGAERMLQQTRFFLATLRAYEARVARSGGLDEHALRELLLGSEGPSFFKQVVVTVGDRLCDPPGLYAADFDLLTRISSLEQVDVIATEATLAAGFHERLHELLPGIEEEESGDEPPSAAAAPTLVTPSGADDRCYFVSRDREEELIDTARTVKRGRRDGDDAWSLDRTAVVFRRPLPYVYLARTVFGAAGIPFQTHDALPLAAEPYASALDLLFTALTSGFTREAIVRLLGSPLFSFAADGRRPDASDVAALDRALAHAGYLGDLDHLERLVAGWTGPQARTGQAAMSVARVLQPLTIEVPASVHLARLIEAIRNHERLPVPSDPGRERHLRARSAILAALAELRDAHQRYDDPAIPFGDLASTIRRWTEDQTFTPRAGSGGVQFVDAQAAPYCDANEVFLVGLVEGEWPDAPRRNIFYPPFLLAQLGWPAETARLAAARAAFDDLLRLPRHEVFVSAFSLEEDAIVEPSSLLEDLAQAGLPVRRAAGPTRGRILPEEALALEPIRPDAVTGAGAAWAQLRLSRTPARDPRFHGSIGSFSRPRHTVSSVDRYIECPFRYFAAEVLRLEEEPEEEIAMTPKARGRFVHEVLRAFYDEWQRNGHGAITPENLDQARAEFSRVAERLLTTLPETEASLERVRLLGSPAARGIGEAVCASEAARPTPVVERLLEVTLDGVFDLRRDEGHRALALRAKADRIDRLAGGSLRVIDYKLVRAPDPRRSIQLPIYAVCAQQRLRRAGGEPPEIAEAAYIAFGSRDPFKAVVSDAKDSGPVLVDGQRRFLDAVDGIERGEFPPRPAEPMTCASCPFASVCRKEFVGDADPETAV